MIPLHRIAALVYNTPLFITPAKAEIISGVLLEHIHARIAGTPRPGRAEDAPNPAAFVGEILPSEGGRGATPYRVTKAGQAVVTIDGELVNRGEWVGADSGLVSYDGIKHQLAVAVQDSRVRSIILDINSPGGEAVGMFDAAAAVRRAAATKPVYFIANGLAASAGYGIGSGATKRFITPDGMGGSIGTVLMHIDMSRAIENRGIKPTLIFAGAHKVDGNPFEKLPESVRQSFQDEVNRFYGLFVQTVAAGTGLSEDHIRGTEARLYVGQEAVDAKLFDSVATLDDVLTQTGTSIITTFTSPRVAASTSVKETDMFTKEFKQQIGLPETATDAEVLSRVEEMKSAATRLSAVETDLKAEKEKREAAEIEKSKAIANAKVDSWEREGKISGNATLAVREVYVAAATGQTVTAEQIEKMVAALPQIDTTRVAKEAIKRADPNAKHDVTIEDFKKSATDANAARRIDAAVRDRQRTDPKFTRDDLRRELMTN
ncbi:MAG TPA: S49 family peptidase [Thermoanaerobaculia bacterium]|nr:S49 family peptidase [Thermoanaerobaculia bacterium]